jgi:hypothetical protein
MIIIIIIIVVVVNKRYQIYINDLDWLRGIYRYITGLCNLLILKIIIIVIIFSNIHIIVGI